MSSSARSGFRRASLGTLLCLGGMFAGVFCGIPKLHQAMTADQTPVTMTCLELVRSGIPEQSSVVSLTDAVIHPPGDLELSNEVIESAENDTVAAGLTKIQALLAHPRAKVFVDRVARGDVLPRGVPHRDGYQPLRLSFGRKTAEFAQAEVEKGEVFTVHVSENPTARYLSKVAGWVKLELPESLANQADLPALSLHPASLVASQREAVVWTVGGVIALALGLVCCGSARIGWWVILSPLAAILGLSGIPFRNGRGNRFTRLLGLVVGAGALAAAYHLAFDLGALGQPGGQWLWQATGLAAASFGLASLIGTWLNVRSCKQDASAVGSRVGPKKRATKRSKKKSKMQLVQDFQSQIEKKPDQLNQFLESSSYTRRYLDPKLSVSAKTETEGELEIQNKSLEKLHFDSPLLIEQYVGDQMSQATIQVGCKNLVMVMLEEASDQIRIFLTSILEDGHVVASSSGYQDRLPKNVSGEAATVYVFDSPSASKLVTLHLERAANVAEQRGSNLVVLDPSEWRDIVHYGERCLAQTLHELKLERWDVADAQYGRFSFPPAEVLVPAMA